MFFRGLGRWRLVDRKGKRNEDPWQRKVARFAPRLYAMKQNKSLQFTG